jgi:hypothetical protein
MMVLWGGVVVKNIWTKDIQEVRLRQILIKLTSNWCL